MSASPDDHEELHDLSRAEVRRRALSGVLFLSSSGAASFVVAFVSSLALARMLTPEAFGVVAIGSALALLCGVIVDGGFGAGFVRRVEPPTRTELRALTGIQLTVALVICITIVAISSGRGETGAVTAFIAFSIPVTALQIPGRTLLFRAMNFPRQSIVDFGAQLSAQVFAVGTVALGAGVWGLASAPVVRAMAGVLLLYGIGGPDFVTPSWRGWAPLGPIVRFGIRFQASSLAVVGREFLINLATGMVAGTQTLGLWSLANRMLQFPLIVFGSMWTVAYPAMSNLYMRGDDPVPTIQRTVRRAAIGGTLVFPAVAASSRGVVPGLFGQAWSDAADVVPFFCLSTLILGSVSVGTVGYLSAAGRPGLVASAQLAFGVTWVALTVLLLPRLDLVAIGIGNLIGALIETALLARAIHGMVGVTTLRDLGRPMVVAITAGGVSLYVSFVVAPTLLMGVACGAVCLALSILGLGLLCRADFALTVRLAYSAFGRGGK